MQPDIDQLLLHSGYNAFKNNGVHRGALALPDSHSAGVGQKVELTFTLAEDTDFTQLLVYSTDYAKYFRYLDSQYHDTWQPVEQSLDFLLFDHPVTQLFYYTINQKVVNNVVTVILTINSFFGNFNIDPNKTVPVAFVEYTLAR